jgi:signal peptidase II
VRKFLFFAAVAGGTAALDLATKALIEANFRLYESVPVVKGFFHLTYVRNPGAAFGMFGGTSSSRIPFFVVLTLAVLAVLLWMYSRLGPGTKRVATGFALIFGGAVGNLVDRLRYGEVVDFLDVFLGNNHWPAFNVADVAICVGAGLILLDELTSRKQAA